MFLASGILSSASADSFAGFRTWVKRNNKLFSRNFKVEKVASRASFSFLGQFDTFGNLPESSIFFRGFLSKWKDAIRDMNACLAALNELEVKTGTTAGKSRGSNRQLKSLLANAKGKRNYRKIYRFSILGLYFPLFVNINDGIKHSIGTLWPFTKTETGNRLQVINRHSFEQSVNALSPFQKRLLESALQLYLKRHQSDTPAASLVVLLNPTLTKRYFSPKKSRVKRVQKQRVARFKNRSDRVKKATKVTRVPKKKPDTVVAKNRPRKKRKRRKTKKPIIDAATFYDSIIPVAPMPQRHES